LSRAEVDIVGTTTVAVVQVIRDGAVIHECYPDGVFSFDEVGCLALYPDVAKAVGEGHLANGRWHYLSYGMQEGRRAPLRGPSAAGSRSTRLAWFDLDVGNSAKVFYAIRAIQADGQLAVSSPIAGEVRYMNN
jgi:hypothetical protein